MYNQDVLVFSPASCCGRHVTAGLRHSYLCLTPVAASSSAGPSTHLFGPLTMPCAFVWISSIALLET